MAENVYRDIVRIIYSREVEDALKKLKKRNKDIFDRVEKQIIKILREPNIGKPLRYTLRNRRRVHVGSFVLIYEFHQGELRFIDFDHHDLIYKKSKQQ
ncbi:MAG: type II toxin-antitoxin system RelE/ParE family toxin [bacterium]|nr:type II toxin-antitoxin system RelE/ParE family toxin [bacterium]